MAVIDIHNCNRLRLFPLAAKLCEKLRLGIEVALHRPVKIEMVLREIGKDSHVPFEAARAILRERMRRNFHRGSPTTRVNDLCQQFL